MAAVQVTASGISRCPPANVCPSDHAPTGTFEPELETEYVRSRLLGNRTLIRIACTFAALIAAARSAELLLMELRYESRTLAVIAVLAISIALVCIAWSRFYERLYMPIAEIAVPIRNTIAAVFIVAAAAAGRSESLMLLPLMIVGPHFFLGLRFRPAMLSTALTVAAFAASAAVFGLAPSVAFSAAALLLMAAGGSIVGARHIEQSARSRFVESHLIAEQARTDALTQLTNRRVFDAYLEQLWLEAGEERASIAVMLADIDHFKAHNDSYGHQAGDRTLKRVAQTLQALVTGPRNLIARYGGEEFAVLLHDVDGEQAHALAQRMRLAVSELQVKHRGARHRAAVTISIGVAVVDPGNNRRPRGALQLADQALYEAKRRGRNRVELMDQAAHHLLETGVFSLDSLARG